MQQFIDHIVPKYRIGKRYRITRKPAPQKVWGKIIQGLKFNNFYSHFAVETLLLLILIFTVSANFSTKANFQEGKISNRSLFFGYLKSHPQINNKLVDAYETVNLKLSQNYSLVPQVLAATAIQKEEPETNPARETPLPSMAGTALMKPNPADSSMFPKQDIQEYVVRGGDTLSAIAATYNVSVSTIALANNISENGTIKPGVKLEILPTNGVKHIIREGETISAIARKYDVDEEAIFDYNELEGEDLIMPGDELIIPGGTVKSPAATAPKTGPSSAKPKQSPERYAVPDDYQGAGGDLLWPVPATRRVSQYASRRHMALDIPCRGGCMAVAVADGIVELAGWQSGYGNTLVINHGNGTRTRYAHAQNLLVKAGQSIAAGQNVIIIGSTGRSTGPHLHFEVKVGGALQNPMGYVK